MSLGDLGESKDCTGSGTLFAGTTECHKLAADYLNGYGQKFDVVGGNHDLEGIDEFFTDEANLEAYLRELGAVENCDKKTAQFCHEVAEKTVLIGLGSTKFRSAQFTSHEVVVDDEQVAWFRETIAKYPAEDGWKVFCFSHAPIIGSGLRVLQECHVVNGRCWLNHNDGPTSRSFIETVRANPSIKGWFSGHFHLSHDYEDSMSFPEGNNRGACIFAQTAVMTARSTRDGRRQSRLIRGNKDGFEVCTVNHAKGGEVRIDAKISYTDCGTSIVAEVCEHEDITASEGWFRSYTPQEEDGCYIKDSEGVLNDDATWDDSTVCWWHMADGAVLGVHDGMVIEYDPTTLAPLGMVVSKDELAGRKVAVIDSGLEAEQVPPHASRPTPHASRLTLHASRSSPAFGCSPAHPATQAPLVCAGTRPPTHPAPAAFAHSCPRGADDLAFVLRRSATSSRTAPSARRCRPRSRRSSCTTIRASARWCSPPPSLRWYTPSLTVV